MTGALPPTPPPVAASTVPSAGSAPPVPVEAAVESVPPRLRDLPRPVAVSGTVVDSRMSAEGAVSRVRTASGEIVVRTETPLPPGPVTVQITPGRPPTQAVVQLPAPTTVAAGAAGTAPPLSLGGASVPAGQVAVPLPAAPGGAAALPATTLAVTPGLPALVPGAVVRAQLLPSAQAGLAPQVGTMPGMAPGGALAPGATAPGLVPTALPAQIPGTGLPAGAIPAAGPAGAIMPGTALPGSILPGATTGGPAAGVGGPTLPGASLPSPGSASATPATPGAPTLPGPATAAAGSSGPGPALPGAGGPPGLVGPGGVGTLRVVAVGEEAARGAGPGQAVTTVTGTTIGGQPIVASDRGLLVLQAQGGFPPGTRVTLETVAPAVRAATTAPAPIDPLGGRDWPAMQQALAALDQTDPQAGRAVLNGVLPHMNARFATNAALFMGVMRAGLEARAWLGDRGVRALETGGRRDLVDRLSEDVRSLQRQGDAAGAEWRAYPIPVVVDGAFDRVVVRVRRREDDGEGDGGPERGGGGTRFLVDVELSRLGPMQLDGLVRPKRLDLIVRTRDALDPALRTELRTIFAGSLADLVMSGDLGFQSGRTAAWVPLKPTAPHGRGIVA